MSHAAAFETHVQDHRARLATLPYADHAEPDGDALEQLRRAFEKFTPLQVIRWEANLSDPYYRVLSLDFLMHHHSRAALTTWSATDLSEETFVEGDLHVQGNLTNRSNLVVLGDLTIEGGYVALGEYPCLSVGGDFSCNGMYANEAETICLGKLEAAADVVLVYNHTVTIARELHAATLITADARVDAEVHSPNHLEDPADQAVAAHFGLTVDDDAPDYDAAEFLWDPVIGLILGE